jgi:hypothetical protein
MEHESPHRSDFLGQPAFDVDLEPLYALSEAQYQTVINQLSNLVVAIIRHVQQTDNPEFARLIAGRAQEILLDYDEDVAERVRWVGRDPTAEESVPTDAALGD